MGIQINGQTDTISASDGGLAVSGQELTSVTDINASGIVTATTFNGDVKVATGSTISGGTNYITASTNGSERVRVESDGDLLLGTTSDYTFIRPYDTTTGNLIIGADQGATGTSGSALIFRSRGTERARIYSGGTVGINTDGDPTAGGFASPQVYVKSTSTSWTGGIHLEAFANDSVGVINHSNDGLEIAQTYRSGGSYKPIMFRTSGTERVRINAGGAFEHGGKINNAAAGSGTYLSGGNGNNYIKADINYDFALLVRNDATTSPRQLRLQSYGISSGDSSTYPLFYDDLTQARFYFYSNGGLANIQSNDTNLCDEREKKNIEALDSTWDCLKHWELKKFHYNDDADTDDKRYGVIAQQVEPHCPEVITKWVKKPSEEAVLDDDGNVVTPAQEEITRLGVKEQQMYWMAIKALQEAQTRIETLEAKVAALEAQ